MTDAAPAPAERNAFLRRAWAGTVAAALSAVLWFGLLGLLGIGLIVAGVYVVAGLGAALIVGGVFALFAAGFILRGIARA